MFSKIKLPLLLASLVILAASGVFSIYKLHRIERRLDRIDPFGALHPELGADFKSLRKIKFPDNPTKEALRAYISDIVLSAKNQTGHSPDDPQIDLLTRVGEDNIDLLIEAARLADPWQQYHLSIAISKLATDRSRPLIIEALPDNMELASILTDHGWEAYAKPILLDEMQKNSHYVPTALLQAVVNLNDPCATQEVLNYLVTGTMKYITYEIVNRSTKQDLSSYVAKAWENVKAVQDSWDQKMFATVAVAYGHADALKVIIQNLDTSINHDSLRRAILDYTEAVGTDDQLIEWYVKNRNNLYFDKESKKFRVKQ